jgi:hypothetical protein
VCLFYETVGDRKSFHGFCRGSIRPAVPHVMQGSWITKKESSSSGGKAVLDSNVLRLAGDCFFILQLYIFSVFADTLSSFSEDERA